MGVGLAVLLGVLRFMYGWSLKVFIIPSVLILSALTVWAHFNDTLNPMIGLAWDCGAVTTGPVTVPLVLALGIGVCRVVNTGDSSSAGFGIGISLGLTPLGSQLGSNIPSAFAKIKLWGLDGFYGPLFGETSGKITAIIFGFFLGYGATLAEPALNALGSTVERITVGSFKKSLIMQTVAIGVGTGIAIGVLKIAYNVPLSYLLIPPYLGLLILTVMSSEAFVNFGWDSAGVTTGPITVPLVLAMGLGIGANIPGVIDGFGVLALAS